VRVLDAGPIPYPKIALFGDLSLEHGLEHFGVEPSETAYRLIEVSLPEITDTAAMPYRVWDRSIAEAMKEGVEFPPLVVFHNWKREGWSLLDGANRTNAYLALGVPRVQAYELILTGF
jgi:hypothetical protein